MEEREAITEFGDAYRVYIDAVPGFIPRFGSRGGDAPRLECGKESRANIGHPGRGWTARFGKAATERRKVAVDRAPRHKKRRT